MTRRPTVVMLLGVLTAIQAGIALWRIGVMYGEGWGKGLRPLELSSGLLEEVALSLFIALAAWWWIPRDAVSPARWGLRFLVIGWTLAIGQMTWVLALGFFERGVSWAILLLLFAAGTIARNASGSGPGAGSRESDRSRHPAVLGAVMFWLLQLPHLFFSYHWTDTKTIWACRTVAFEATGGLTGIFDCVDPGRPPLHSILLWLGHTNSMFEGRLLPFLAVGAFGLVLHHFLRRVAPAVAPWGLLWFFMTVRVYQGAVSSYADVPVMLAIAVGIFLAVDQELVPSRWQAVIFGIVAGTAAALIKRDGGALILVATAAVWWLLPRRREPRIYAALVGAAIGFALWSTRPAALSAPNVFEINIGTVEPIALPIRLISQEAVGGPPDSVAEVPPDTVATVQTYITMFYGMQGQVLSHYGYGMFVPAWIILGLWLWRRRERLSPEGRLYTWLAVLGWLAIVGIYLFHVSTGHAYRGSLHVIRTAFGRHLLHMFVFALLSAAVIAEVLVTRARARSPE